MQEMGIVASNYCHWELRAEMIIKGQRMLQYANMKASEASETTAVSFAGLVWFGFDHWERQASVLKQV